MHKIIKMEISDFSTHSLSANNTVGLAVRWRDGAIVRFVIDISAYKRSDNSPPTPTV